MRFPYFTTICLSLCICVFCNRLHSCPILLLVFYINQIFVLHPLFFLLVGSWGVAIRWIQLVFLGNGTKVFKIWRGGKCSVVVPPTIHVIFILDSHSTTPIGRCCHRPRIYAEHSSVARLLSGDCRAVSLL